MGSKYILATFFLLAAINLKAQTPQFAVVRPNGTTYICPTFDSAYNKAMDDDYIYLPGTVISGDKTITKKLTIIGAGHYPDSTQYTGKSLFTGQFLIEKKCTLEGIEIANSLVIMNAAASNSSFIRIRASALYLGGTNDHFIDGSAISYITGRVYNSSSCVSSANLFVKNSILQSVSSLQFSSFNNSIFLGSNSGWFYLKVANSSFINCIFRGLFNIDWFAENNCYPLVGNSSNYCINPVAAGNNNYSSSQADTLFVNSPNASSFDYQYNYHLKPNSPYREGAVPSNPHIYFKQVSTQTNSNGQLPVQFKVRTSN